MNTLFSIALSLGTGIIIGILYGLFFVRPRKRVLLSQATNPENIRRNILSIATHSVLRMLSFMLVLTLILRIPSFNPWVVLFSMMVSFWLVIIKHKAV